MIVVVILVVVAAGVGASLRAVLSRQLNREQFPYGTFAINIAASLLLGLLAGAGDQWQTVLGVGALGALSTWSAVASEVAGFARSGQGGFAFLYLVAMCTLGILAAWTGLQLSG